MLFLPRGVVMRPSVSKCSGKHAVTDPLFTDFSREDEERRNAVVGTPEYTKRRYPGVCQTGPEFSRSINTNNIDLEGLMRPGREPYWLINRRQQIVQRIAANKSYIKNEYGGGIKSLVRNNFIRDLQHCIQKGMSFKTKTFEYNAPTGNLYVNGYYIAHFDDMDGSITSWTLKNDSSNLTLLRLRDFGVYLKRIRGKICWIIGIGQSIPTYLEETGKTIEDLIGHDIFDSIEIKKFQNSEEDAGLYLELGVLPNITYPFSFYHANLTGYEKFQELYVPAFLLPKIERLPMRWEDIDNKTGELSLIELQRSFRVAAQTSPTAVIDLFRENLIQFQQDISSPSFFTFPTQIRLDEILFNFSPPGDFGFSNFFTLKKIGETLCLVVDKYPPVDVTKLPGVDISYASKILNIKSVFKVSSIGQGFYLRDVYGQKMFITGTNLGNFDRIRYFIAEAQNKDTSKIVENGYNGNMLSLLDGLPLTLSYTLP